MNFLTDYFIDGVFYTFAFGIIASCTLLIFSKTTLYAALSLIAVFFNASALLILMEADFMGLILLLMYVGAIAVLFLFGMMMTTGPNSEDLRLKLSEKILLLIVSLLMVTEFGFLLLVKAGNPSQKFLQTSSTEVLKIQSLGEVLYTDYFLIFQLLGVVLFIAMVSVVALLNPDKEGSPKKQGIFKDPGRSRITLHGKESPVKGEE
ncbi:MAG: NADH-quinone oxidoreductase subunit J [Alphaproteobacteria bacterium]